MCTAQEHAGARAHYGTVCATVLDVLVRCCSNGSAFVIMPTTYMHTTAALTDSHTPKRLRPAGLLAITKRVRCSAGSW